MESRDTKNIKRCLELITEKQGWGDSQTWTQTNFLRLSQNIYNTTGVNISFRTLRRLFGKDKYKEQHNPQYETKNALALYLGYESWDDFNKKLCETGGEPNQYLNKGKNTFSCQN